MNEKIFIPVICGPTASGKTALGVELAHTFDGEIISADSMQIYKGMNIASAKPSEEEKQGIPHHLMDVIPLEKAFSVADYVKLAHKVIFDINSRGKLPILVGGTGLYINSLIYDIKFEETETTAEYRALMENFVHENGNLALWEKLRKIDPDAAKKIHPNNVKRVTRALEVYYSTGETITDAQKKSRLEGSRYIPLFIMPDYPREILYDRINERVDKMLEVGLVEETREFFLHKDYRTCVQAIGYKELKPYIDGQASLEECTEKLKRATRNYAKRQLTWFGKIPDLNRICINFGEKCEKIFKIAENLVKSYSNFRQNML